MSETETIEAAILDTLSFHEGYPLFEKEMYELLITSKLSGRVLYGDFASALNNLMKKGLVIEKDGYYCHVSENIDELIKTRRIQNEIARQKIRVARKDLEFLKRVAFVKFVGVVGLVATGKCDQPSKVKLIIITNPKFKRFVKNLARTILWLTRRLNKYSFRDPIPLSEGKIEIGNLEMAYEILTIKPLVNKNGTFEKYINLNMWIFDYFSNYPLRKVSNEYRIKGRVAKQKGRA